ncbi:hypothetical protein [Verrucomicrobium spinosum]|uniref:hypothetical protein n=1 Tax=Verrucomicrobium spinosum TaxID=2736 RepID=UPI000946774F|nr:hypothetical protein [Verrucomicrobium spinosum]
MRRAIKVDRAKTEAVLKHAYALLKQSPEEQNTIQAGSREGPANQYLMKMGCVPQLMRQVLELADASGVSRTTAWSSQYFAQMQGEEKMRDVAHAFSILQGTPVVADVGEFRDIALRGSSWETALGEIASWFRWDQYSDLKKQVLTELASRQPRTFGSELTGCLIGDEEDNRMMTAFLKRRREALGRLTDEAASNLLALLGTRYYAITSPVPLDPALKELLNPLLEAETWHLDSVRFTWRAMKGFDELKLDPRSAALEAHHSFRRLAVRDQGLARQFLEDGLRLFRTLPGKEGENGARELLQEAANEPEMLDAVLKLAAREGFTQQGDWLSTTLFRAWRPGDHVPQPQRLITFLEAAGVLGNASDFTRYWRVDEPHDKGFVKRILSTFAGRPSAGKVFLPVLMAQKPRTFGADVLQALLNPVYERNLTQVVAEYRTELETLPADRQAELARFLTLWVRDLDALALAAPGLAAGLKLHQSEKNESAQSLVDRILNAAQMKELFDGSSPHDMEMRSGTGLPSGRSGAVMIRPQRPSPPFTPRIPSGLGRLSRS